MDFILLKTFNDMETNILNRVVMCHLITEIITTDVNSVEQVEMILTDYFRKKNAVAKSLIEAKKILMEWDQTDSFKSIETVGYETLALELMQIDINITCLITIQACISNKNNDILVINVKNLKKIKDKRCF